MWNDGSDVELSFMNGKVNSMIEVIYKEISNYFWSVIQIKD